MCPRLKTLNVTRCPVSLLVPLLTASGIVTTLRELDLDSSWLKSPRELACLLPTLALSTLRLKFINPLVSNGSKFELMFPAVMNIYPKLIFALPSSIRSLSLDFLGYRNPKLGRSS